MHLHHGNVTNKVWETGDCAVWQCVPHVVFGLHPHVCYYTWHETQIYRLAEVMTSWLCLWQWLGGYLQFWGSCLIFFSDSSNFRQCSNVHARRHKCSRWCLQNNQCNWYLISNFSIGLYISSTSYLLEKNLFLFQYTWVEFITNSVFVFFISTCIKKINFLV